MTAVAMYDRMKAKLANVVPDVELRLKADIAEKVVALKRQYGDRSVLPC